MEGGSCRRRRGTEVGRIATPSLLPPCTVFTMPPAGRMHHEAISEWMHPQEPTPQGTESGTEGQKVDLGLEKYLPACRQGAELLSNQRQSSKHNRHQFFTHGASVLTQYKEKDDGGERCSMLHSDKCEGGER